VNVEVDELGHAVCSAEGGPQPEAIDLANPKRVVKVREPRRTPLRETSLDRIWNARVDVGTSLTCAVALIIDARMGFDDSRGHLRLPA